MPDICVFFKEGSFRMLQAAFSIKHDTCDYFHANCLKNFKYLNYFTAAIFSNQFEDFPGKVYFMSD